MVLDPNNPGNPQDNPANPPNPEGSVWRESLPAELKVEKSLDVFKGKDWNEVGPLMAKSYVEGQKMIGGSIRVPKEDAKPEDWDPIYNKLGRPETPDKYVVKLPNEEFIQYNGDGIARVRARAHKDGLSNKQLQGILDVYGELATEEIQARKKSFDDGQAALRAEWPNPVVFDRNIALAKRVRDQFGGEDLKDFFKDDPSGNDPRVIRFMAKLGELLEEGDYFGGAGETGGLTPAEAQAKIAEIKADKKDAYWLTDDPRHNERVKEVEALYVIAYNKI
jgi:hypothetical protein